MQKEIKYTGYSASPSDYESLDGDLSTAVGLVPEDSTLKPIRPPKEEFDLDAGEELLLIHKGNGYTHYIVKGNSNKIYYYNEGGSKTEFATLSGVTEAKAIGNTLILLNGGGMNYYLWQNSQYRYLGDHIPELPLSFGLQPERYPTPPTEANFEVRYTRDVDLVAIVNMSEDAWALIPTKNKFKILTEEIGGFVDEGHSLLYDPNCIGAGSYSDELKNVVTQQVMAQVNKHIASGMYDSSTFMFPFFVRYAYRLYDGSLTMHSAPILMPCATHQNPYILVKPSIRCTVDSDNVYSTERIDDNHTKVIWHAKEQVMTCSLIMEMFRLDYITVAGNTLINTLTDWKDIVNSVDVFVSAPLYTIEQSGLCTGVDVSGTGYTGHSVVLYNGAYQQVGDVTLFNPNAVQHGGQVKLPLKESHEQIINCSNFYFYYSIPTENLNTTQVRQILAKDKDYFRSLTGRELMTDDYDSHDTLIPKAMFPYNSRLSIANLSKLLAKPFNPLASLPYTNGGTMQNVVIYVYLKVNNTTKVIQCWGSDNFLMSSDAPVHYLYYPHPGAYQAKILWSPLWAVYNSYTVPLKAHPTLNGAYYFSDWNTNRTIVAGDSRPNETSRETSLPNKIYTSEVNNPFFFPVSGIVTVGAANILDICSAARALSEGQFGQFPLYAFTDEGVWALELSDTGTYKARQPITRDVCISSDSITQIDTAVLFATDRGIMLISGSDSTCISDSLTSPSTDNPKAELQNLDKVIGDYADDASLNYVPFLEYIKGCRMIYDYVHQRIIVFNPETTEVNGVVTPKYSYAYVYSLKSKQWGMMQSSIKDTTNSYPDALAVVQEGSTQYVVDYTKEQEPQQGQEQVTKAVLITRPLKLDAPDVLKTVNTVITRGNFQRGHVKTILYGSRDLINWQLIGSSVDHYLRYLHGTPYKYFRIVLLCDLDKGESVTGSTIEYTPRQTNQVR